MLSIGSYVRLKTYPRTHSGTVAGAEIHDGKMRYVFHLDERILGFSYADRYIYEEDVEECEMIGSRQVELINRHARKRTRGSGKQATQKLNYN